MRGSGARVGTAVAATAIAVLAASPACPAEPAPGPITAHAADTRAAPGDRPLTELLGRLKTLYRQADAAAAAYRRTGRKLRAQRAEVARLDRRLARVRAELASHQEAAGELARRQYRTGAFDLPPAAGVLLADDPVLALRAGHALERAADWRAATLRSLASAERHRGAVAAKARAALRRKKALTERRKRHRNTAQARLREVERLLTSLSATQLARLRSLEALPPGAGTAAYGGRDGRAG